MTAEWIKLGAQSQSMSGASASFAHALDTNVDGMKRKQEAFEARIGELKAQVRPRQNAIMDVMSSLQREYEDLEPYIKKARKMTPESRQRLTNDVMDIDRRRAQCERDLQAISTDIESMAHRETARLGAGLRCRPVVDGHPFAIESLAQDLYSRIEQPGFYALHVSLPDGVGHVMGVQVGEDGRCKFMDPNTGEFGMSNRKDLINLVATAVAGGYSRSTSFSIQHFVP
ncbi:MAG: hypothetical protein ABW123_25455 [Cystobacter sp.]